MTLDLDELERKARAAHENFDTHPPTLAEWNNGRLAPRVVLALIERVRAAEAAIPRCGCGATSSTRGDPECDGCGKDCYYCECPGAKGGT